MHQQEKLETNQELLLSGLQKIIADPKNDESDFESRMNEALAAAKAFHRSWSHKYTE